MVLKLAEITIKTDNGAEFTAPWSSLKKTLFIKIIEYSITSTHKTIPAGAKTDQRLSKMSFTLAGIFPALKTF